MLSWTIEDEPDAASLAVLADGVQQFGRLQAADGDARPIACLVRRQGRIVAGGSGRTEYGRLFVAQLWVDEALRGVGIGTRVLHALEDSAQARGCQDAVIETLLDRTAALYRRLGYAPLATLEGHVGPFTRHILHKRLGPGGACGSAATKLPIIDFSPARPSAARPQAAHRRRVPMARPPAASSNMRNLLAAALLGLTLVNPTMSTAAPAAADDSFLWLEDVQGAQALDWVRAHNAPTRARLTADALFQPTKDRLLQILDSRERIPAVSRRGDAFYNLWRDAAHPRGLWRRTTLAEYRKPQPAWETVLDLDALAAAEKENWVWGGSVCLGPTYRRCLVKLSRGGADATAVREFDTVDKRFVDGGFTLPEAKLSVEWADADTLYVGTDFGAGSLTDSGYPRVIKRWKRGEPLSAAVTVFEGASTDVSVSVGVDRTPGFERTVFSRATDFYNDLAFLLEGGKAVAIDKPTDAQIDFWDERLLMTLRSDLKVGGTTFARGSLLVTDAKAYLKGPKDERHFEALFTPTPTRSLAGYATTQGKVLLNISDTVASRLEELSPKDGGWQRRSVDVQAASTVSVQSLHDPLIKNDALGEAYFFSVENFTTPSTLALARTGSDAREPLKSNPVFWDADGVRVEQQFATSKDGTRVPYFIVWPKGAKADGGNPTLLYGYGGFEIALRPWYMAGPGNAWVGKGGVYVVANIRGGGEFGPGWHQAAVKADKQKSYDDFAAVAEDLIARKVTQPRHLGIQGGSNGGLLMGAVMLQRPELFNAVLCEVPLLDMQRYNKLLAGASWMGEYGNPDDPSEWAFISKYSPYQNLKPGQKLPAVLFTTSTRDDRVHPGHARKMAARMEALGYQPLYYEHIEGGHGLGADNAGRADMMALGYTFLWEQLGRSQP